MKKEGGGESRKAIRRVLRKASPPPPQIQTLNKYKRTSESRWIGLTKEKMTKSNRVNSGSKSLRLSPWGKISKYPLRFMGLESGLQNELDESKNIFVVLFFFFLPVKEL